MIRKNRYYPPEFKKEALGLLTTGEYNMAQLERELGITAGLLRQWQPQKPLIHHNDRGSQYTSKAFQELLTAHNITPSMSGRGNCYDNAPVESFFGTLKTELVNHAVYRTRQDAMTDIFFFIEGFYNRNRRHSSLVFLSPADFEAAAVKSRSFESCDFVSINPG